MIFILYICLHKKRQNASCSFECENRVSTEKRQEMGEGRSESGQWRLLVINVPKRLNSSDFLHCRDQLWDLNSNDGSLTRPALDVQMKIGSVQHAQPFAHIAQPDAFHVDMRHFFFRDTHAVIFDFDAQTPVAVRCSQFDFPAAQLRREAM